VRGRGCGSDGARGCSAQARGCSAAHEDGEGWEGAGVYVQKRCGKSGGT
jgi:hypothetical protein